MKVELALLNRSLESEIVVLETHVKYLLGLVFIIAGVLIAPKSTESGYFLFRFVCTVALLIIYYEVNSRLSSDKIIAKNTIGQLICDHFKLLIESDKERVVINSEYKGAILFKYEGYKGEPLSRRIQGAGTHNTIVIMEEGSEKKFYVYLKTPSEKRDFFRIARWAVENKIATKEFTKGERTYLGKKLNYQEIQAFKQEYGV